MPYTNKVIHSFFGGRSISRRASFALLKAGECINPHRDLHPHWHRKVRLHIPIRTDDKITYYVWSTENELKKDDRFRSN
jgi:aspartyl/asparaginyl beta-hydroxylase (cupin superfamily)